MHVLWNNKELNINNYSDKKHLIYIYFKLVAKNKEELETLIQAVEVYSQDIRME